MRHVLLAALLLLAGARAEAQAAPAPSCWYDDPAAKNFTLTLFPATVPQVVASWDQASMVATWWCDVKYGWRSEGRWGYARNFVPGWESLLSSLPAMPRAEKYKLYVDSMKCYMDDPRPECDYLEPLEAIAKEQYKATRPPDIVWRVRDNPTATSRPVFPVTNGVRSTTATAERISDSAVCSCMQLAIEESGGTYCSVAGQQNLGTAGGWIAASRVALCFRTN